MEKSVKVNFSLFPTLVAYHNGVLAYEQSVDIFKLCKTKHAAEHALLIGDASSTHDLKSDVLSEVEQLPSCKGLVLRLTKLCNEYMRDYGNPVDVEIGNSWFNFQQVGSRLTNHVHANSFLSAALYINVNPKVDKLVFETPNPHTAVFNPHPPEGRAPFSDELFYVGTNPGSLVIFPSWLKHGSNGAVNQTEDRLVVSFNAHIKAR